MADYLTNLKTARDQIAANIVAITASPKPSYLIGNQQVSWNELFDSYTKSLQSLNDQINGAEPYEYATQGVT